MKSDSLFIAIYDFHPCIAKINIILKNHLRYLVDKHTDITIY